MDSLQRARESKFEIENPNFAITVIRPSRGWISLNLRDLWEYRDGGWRMESIFPSPLSPFHRA